MKREDIKHIIGLLLLFSICTTGVLGYIQSELELRKFVPHRYFAYTTLTLAAVHVALNGRSTWSYLLRIIKKNKSRKEKK